MFGAILMATKSSFQKSMIFCCSIYVKKVMKLLAFIFEQPSYSRRYKQYNIIQLMHSFEVNIRICQPRTVMFTEAKPR